MASVRSLWVEWTPKFYWHASSHQVGGAAERSYGRRLTASVFVSLFSRPITFETLGLLASLQSLAWSDFPWNGWSADCYNWWCSRLARQLSWLKNSLLQVEQVSQTTSHSSHLLLVFVFAFLIPSTLGQNINNKTIMATNQQTEKKYDLVAEVNTV